MKYGDGVQIRGNRDLEECFAQANDQMDILDGLIRELRQMGQPCEMYQKRYCQGRAGGDNVGDKEFVFTFPGVAGRDRNQGGARSVWAMLIRRRALQEQIS